MEQMMEFLKAIEHKREADKAEAKAEREADKGQSKAERKSDKEMMARMEAKMDSNQEKTEAAINSLQSALEGAIKTRVEMKACREVTRLFGGREGTNSKRDRGRGGAAGSPQGSN
jgi:membrane protein involved in colicin uptake